MDLSKPSMPTVNLSSRWKTRRARNLVDDTDFRKKRRSKDSQEPLNAEQQALAARFLPLARRLAKPLKLMYPHWRDEFESAACLALVEAARSFDPARKIRFATFARFRIRGGLVDAGRGMGLSGYELDRENAPDVITLTPFNEEHGKVLVAVVPPPVGGDVDDLDEVNRWLRKLPARHASVCRLHYVFGKTHAEIAGEIGCSQSEVTRLHKKALELLSEPYDSDGNANRRAWRRTRAGRKGKAATEAVAVPVAV